MKTTFKNTFYWSFGGHALLILCLVITSFVTSCKRKTKPAPHVFTVHTAPDQPTPKKQTQTKQAQPVTQQPKTETKKVEKKSEPQKKVKKSTKTPTKRTEPKKQSYADFLKENKLPDPKPTPPKTQPNRQQKTIEPLKDIKNELMVMMRDAPSEMRYSSQSDIQALHGYMSSLRNKINLLWDQPDNLPPGEWIGHIEFTVSGSGKITKVKFVRKSGNVTFDQSLVRAMNQFTSASPPPDRKTHTFEIPFRMNVRH